MVMTLLYIDDDSEDVELFREAVTLANPNSKCIFAENGKEGLQILKTLTPDCIFMDINMPIMDGKETLRYLKKDDRLKSIPVYMLSTTKNSNETNVLREMGARECFVKPNSFVELCMLFKRFFQPAIS
jgi:CheY-like chemotaxis protein